MKLHLLQHCRSNIGEKMPTLEAMYTTPLVFLFLYLMLIYWKTFIAKKSLLPTNWPFFGMIPGLLLNVLRIHDYLTDIMKESGGTFMFKGISFTNTDMLITADPANVQYVLAKNFQNFGKGSDFKKIFDIWGEGIFTAESESWENQRKASKTILNNTSFHQFSGMIMWNEVETKLVPILDSASETGVIVDLQDLFQRLAFDSTCLMILGHDPRSLVKELPIMPLEKAFANAEEAMLLRYFIPGVITRLKKWLHIGTEKKMSEAMESTSLYMSQCMSRIEEKVEQNDDEEDMLSCNRRALADKRDAMNIPEEIWRSLSLNLVFAGKGPVSATLAWLFYLLSINPKQEKKIQEEIAGHARGGTWSFSNIEDLKKLVYLHGAVCETLRLFSPVPFQHKAPIQDDVLPSGHRVKANMNTLLPFYSMGRMKFIWGEDCMEFKPERWISDDGGVIFVPVHKFPAFNAGQRSCLGKKTAIIQLKIVAAAAISRFTIRLAKGHSSVPRPCISTVCHMEDGLLVKVLK